MDKYKKFITTNAQITQEFGKTLANDIASGGTGVPHIICLYGNLGMGKTTLVQGFAKGLGLTSRLLSPTFIIVRRYKLLEFDRYLYHLDLYRVHGEKDMKVLGLPEIFEDPKSIVVIEWADRLGVYLPKNRLDIRLSSGINPSERSIEQIYVKS